jgi:hypothetical protein
LPAYGNTGAMTTPRQNDAQRAGLQQAAYPATIAGRAPRRLGRCVEADVDDLAVLEHGVAGLYNVHHDKAQALIVPTPVLALPEAYNLLFYTLVHLTTAGAFSPSFL